ncbi:DUF134 domain-containing protein [bacterium]|nr:DUF134 domain-containing protein [bacterium]
MPRPCCRRMIDRMPGCRLFKPAGTPTSALEEVILSVDELEALRLADYEGLYQESAAARMNVSRQTFGRIIQSARRKVASALVEAKALRIEGGTFEMPDQRTFTCLDCNHAWSVSWCTGRPPLCPSCGGVNLHRTDGNGGAGRGHGQRRRCLRGRHGRSAGIGQGTENN